MDPIIVVAALELVKLGFQTVLRAQALGQLSDEEIAKVWAEQKEWFAVHPPEELPEVPE